MRECCEEIGDIPSLPMSLWRAAATDHGDESRSDQAEKSARQSVITHRRHETGQGALSTLGKSQSSRFLVLWKTFVRMIHGQMIMPGANMGVDNQIELLVGILASLFVTLWQNQAPEFSHLTQSDVIRNATPVRRIPKFSFCTLLV